MTGIDSPVSIASLTMQLPYSTNKSQGRTMVSGTLIISPGTKVSLGTFTHSVELYCPFLDTSTSQMYLAIPRIVSLLALVSLTVE